MRKSSTLLLVSIVVATSGFAQKTSGSDSIGIAGVEQMKMQLVSRLGLSNEAAAKIVLIESDFARRVDEIKTYNQSPLKAKDKLHEAHVSRRAKLAAVPLQPRQMEDVITLMEQINRKSSSK